MVHLILESINISPLLKASAKLEEAISRSEDWLDKAGSIQCFEYTYELSWKTLKKVLSKKGKDHTTPRDVFRAAAADKLIDDPELWFDYTEKRNQTSHTYNEEVAEEIFDALPGFLVEVKKLIERMKSLK